ncbi:GNAT family N-acetyltransferase [Streptomyces sp. WMMC500]|uniref:GNAT family N-acetyltransferase n=1 Tax=Streptomyces sp. WMMC500 TaxID=3015154 RepID=UPI00248ABBA9|nr:GNAT family N-acetyltransferase [Streptomyces sp. WMMC500]WBB57734.1 GNAT family N-acetyltransferase [Streptomyces sp. WMMC500]
MSDLRFTQPVDDDALRDWRDVHNVTIPTHQLSLDDVRDRAGRHHLEVAYLDGVLVGCSTVRPPEKGSRVSTVIARVLADHRRKGIGEELYVRGLYKAWELGAEQIETVVLSSNESGLLFAQKHGFVETERYVLPGETVPWVDMKLAR